MSERARAYQEQVTGAPRGAAYRLRNGDSQVDFDGFDPKEELLLEAKGPGYEKFIKDDMEMKDFFKGFRKMLEQAQRQSDISEGRRIRWMVAEKRFADILRKAFETSRFPIEVVHVPPVP
ncbi:restriction endonuclease fold toxin 5 domain-containing protein [Corallococcus soli]